MSKKGKRLREFEKNNRTYSFSDASQRRENRSTPIESRRHKEEPKDETLEVKKKVRKKKRLKITNIKRFMASVIVVILIASVVVSAVNIVKLTIQRDKLQQQNADLLKLKEDLTQEFEYINSAEYIEQQARKDLKMIKENELLFIVSDEDEKEK